MKVKYEDRQKEKLLSKARRIKVLPTPTKAANILTHPKTMSLTKSLVKASRCRVHMPKTIST